MGKRSDLSDSPDQKQLLFHKRERISVTSSTVENVKILINIHVCIVSEPAVRVYYINSSGGREAVTCKTVVLNRFTGKPVLAAV